MFRFFHFSWYPPGHGDIYASFYNSGLLEDFIKAGKKYMFISNIDNLGATVDVSILSSPMLESLCIVSFEFTVAEQSLFIDKICSFFICCLFKMCQKYLTKLIE